MSFGTEHELHGTAGHHVQECIVALWLAHARQALALLHLALQHHCCLLQALEHGAKDIDSDEEAEDQKPADPTYVQEQQSLKRSFLEVHSPS